jgi:hypothetical protein
LRPERPEGRDLALSKASGLDLAGVENAGSLWVAQAGAFAGSVLSRTMSGNSP